MVASIIIPSWNGLKHLRKCLPSISSQTLRGVEVIVVDNGSEDSSVSYIKKSFPKFKVIELSENLGFAKAVNLGIKESHGKYIILINNDTKLQEKAIEYLVKAANNHPEIGFVASKMLNFFKSGVINAVGGYIDAVGHANNLGMGVKDTKRFNKAGYVFIATGGGGLFKREVFDKVGLFDEDYFAYMEDVDLCFRAQLAGFKGWYEPKAIIYHVHKATSSRNPAFLEYLQFRNMTMTVIKNFPRNLLLRDWNWFKAFLVNINTVRFLASEGYLLSALKAEWYILTNIRKLLQKRKKIQNSKKVPDQYIIENILPKKITFFGFLKPGI
ncbi:MAG: glycosyltransferase family 2 protein [bacterium]|nr:glycosyltransferase family 2 protein [bacterium]